MSQRKEKYLRQSLHQYETVARDVTHLNVRVPEIARDVEQVRDRQFEMSVQRKIDMDRIYTDVDRAFKTERRRHRRETKAARRAFCLSIIALMLSLAVLVTLIIERAELVSLDEAVAAMQAEQQATAQAPAVIIPQAAPTTTPRPTPSTSTPQAVHTDAPQVELIGTAPHYPRYVEAIPLTEEEQMHLYLAADAMDIWYPLAIAMVDVETDFRNIAGDGGNSIGYLQVNKNFHTELMKQVGATDLWKPRDNFFTGLAYLAQMLERTGDLHMGLMAYNMGYSGADQHWSEGVFQSEYSRKVVAAAEYWADVLDW